MTSLEKEEKIKFLNEETPLKKWYSDSFLALLTSSLSFITFLLSAAACYSGNLKQLGPYDLNGVSSRLNILLYL